MRLEPDGDSFVCRVVGEDLRQLAVQTFEGGTASDSLAVLPQVAAVRRMAAPAAA